MLIFPSKIWANKRPLHTAKYGNARVFQREKRCQKNTISLKARMEGKTQLDMFVDGGGGLDPRDAGASINRKKPGAFSQVSPPPTPTPDSKPCYMLKSENTAELCQTHPHSLQSALRSYLLPLALYCFRKQFVVLMVRWDFFLPYEGLIR